MSLIFKKVIKEYIFQSVEYTAYLRTIINQSSTEIEYYFINEPNGIKIEKPSFMAVQSIMSEQFLSGEGLYTINDADVIAFGIFGKLPFQLTLDSHNNQVTVLTSLSDG